MGQAIRFKLKRIMFTIPSFVEQVGFFYVCQAVELLFQITHWGLNLLVKPTNNTAASLETNKTNQLVLVISLPLFFMSLVYKECDDYCELYINQMAKGFKASDESDSDEDDSEKEIASDIDSKGDDDEIALTENAERKARS